MVGNSSSSNFFKLQNFEISKVFSVFEPISERNVSESVKLSTPLDCLSECQNSRERKNSKRNYNMYELNRNSKIARN